MSRQCPYPSCERHISDVMFACRPHWRLLPKLMKDQIWAAWDSGDWQGHRAAKQEAQRFYDDHHRMRGVATSGQT